MYGFDCAGMGLGAFGMILWWLIPIALVVWLFARFKANGKRAATRTPLDILNERYALSEIDQDEYRSRRSDLLQTDANHRAHK